MCGGSYAVDKCVDFKEIVENEPFVTMRLSYDGKRWNTWFVSKNIAMFGYDREDFLSQKISWAEIIHPDDRTVVLTLAHDYTTKGVDDFRLQYRLVTASGESVHITEFTHANRNPDGTVHCFDSTLINTTTVQFDRNIAANHFRQQAVMNDILMSLQDADLESSLQIILNRTGAYLNTSRALLFKDSPDHKTCKVVYEWLNKGITSIMELDYAVTYSTEMPEIYVALRDTGILLVNAGEIPENCREEFEKEGLISSAIFAVYLHGAHYGFVCFDDCVVPRIWDEDTVNFLKNAANLISNVLMRINAEEELHSRDVEIEQMAYTDSLTGLPNRFRLNTDLAKTLRASTESGRSFYAMFTDLDDFKVVNDCYGHDFGDGVLKTFAAYAADLFGDQARVYRFGGDEFVVIFDSDDAGRVRLFLDALMKRAQSPWESLGREFHCSLSIGVVECRAPDDDAQSVIKKADIAMYSAKKAGKNNYAFYTEALESESVNRSLTEALLREAVRDDFAGFELHYQPYSDTVTRNIVGAEALLRLKGPDGDILLPEQFLSLAEYLGIIVPLGEHILSQAARQCRAINSIVGFEDFTITVNMSTRQIQNNIVHRTLEILRREEVNPANIIISFTEGSALGDMAKIIRICKEFKRHGIGTALDDFGSGSSSFINIRSLPVDIIKVSSSYLEDIEDQFTGSFVKLITELGHHTGKKICMNGVEKDSEFAFCEHAGVDLVQGFLLHKPGDVKALFDVIATKTTGMFFCNAKGKLTAHRGTLRA